MESQAICAPHASLAHDSIAAVGVAVGVAVEEKEVDQFLLEAIENPRHRLTILRMELDIQRFMRNSNQNQFEFQHFPTSYLRCAAHRVAQHYGLHTVALDYTIDGLGSRILARKTPESKFPTICLSDIPTKQQLENDQTGKLKIAIRPRKNRTSLVDSLETGIKRNTVRTVEQREEEYDKARARIFSGSPKLEVGSSSTSVADDKVSICSSISLQESYKISIDNGENMSMKDGASRVAIFRDREKDMTDPDYDRSYNRYIKGAAASSHNVNLAPCNGLRSSPLQISHLGQIPRMQPLMSYRLTEPTMNTFGAVGCNQTPPDAVYMQWPAPAFLYADSYEQIGRASFQASVYQQPLSFERWQSR